MNVKNYTLDDLHLLEELSDHRYLCFMVEEKGDFFWASHSFLHDMGCDIVFPLHREQIKKALQTAYDQKDTDITLESISYEKKQYQLSYKKIQVNHQACILFCLVNVHVVMLQDKLDAVSEHRANSLPCGVFVVYVEGRELTCTYHNTYFFHILGYADEELQKADILTTKVIYPDDFERLKNEIFAHIDAGDHAFGLEYRVLCKNGQILWMMARVVLDVMEHRYLAIVLDNTKQKQMVNQLRISEEEKRIALQQGNVFILRYDVKQKILHITDDGILANEKYRHIHEVPECFHDKDFVAKETQDEFFAFFHAMQKGEPHKEAIFKQRLFPKRDYRWIKAKYTMIYDEDKQPETAIISYEDFSEFHEKELAYEKWKISFERSKEETIAYYEYDITNDKFESLKGKMNDILPHDQRQSFTYIAHYVANHFVVHGDRKRYLRVFSREYLLKQYQQGNQHITVEHRRIGEHNEVFWALGDIYLIWDPYAAVVKASILLFDIDAKKRKSIELKRLSETDALTGLYNRGSLFRRMENTLQHSGQHVLHMMILIDLDHFKEINDTYGHQYGDGCLRKVAMAMRDSCRGEDICSRIGGDEFVIFMRNMSLTTNIEKKLYDLHQAISAPDELHLSISVSIGAACYPQHGQDVSTLYRHADEALYHAKRKGRNQYYIYEEENV